MHVQLRPNRNSVQIRKLKAPLTGTFNSLSDKSIFSCEAMNCNVCRFEFHPQEQKAARVSVQIKNVSPVQSQISIHQKPTDTLTLT